MQRKRFEIVVVVLLLFLCAGRGSAQTHLFRQDVDTSGKIPLFGPNRLYYMHVYGAVGITSWPQENGMRTNWTTSNYTYGFRSKLKLAWWESLVLDVAYRYDYFSIRQNKPKLPPLDDHRHQREFISVHNVTGAFYERINFKRRGDVLGQWLDLGVYGDWAFRTSDRFVDQYYDSNSPTGYKYRIKTRIVRLPYVETINYGFAAAYGGDYFALFARYRVNALIKDPPGGNYPDLPKLTIGVEFYAPM